SEALRGRVAGLSSPVSNDPDGGTTLLVRGQNSFGTAGASNAPLIVLDGQIFYGNLADINPFDIQSIDVLKDASSAAIFGARSSAGVIMITTKKGTKGKTTVTVSSSVGFAKLGDTPKFRSPQQYLDFRVDAFEGLSPNNNAEFYRNPEELQNVDINTWRSYSADNGGSFTNNELWFQRLNLSEVELQNFEAGRTVDWFDETTQVGIRHENIISVSGASEKLSQYFSVGHVNNDGVITGENFEAIRARFNMEGEIQSFLKLGANIQFSKDNQAPIEDGRPGFLQANFNAARLVSPYGSKFNEDGTLSRFPHNDASASNPFLFQNNTKDSRDVNLVGNIFAELELPFGFKYRVNWINSLRWYHNLDFSFTTPEQQGSGGLRENFSQYTWNVDNILTWEKAFGDHNFDVTFLYNAESQETFRQFATNTNFVPSEILGFNQLTFGTNPNILNDDSKYTANAIMARLNYGYKGKYLITGSIRRDGYSAFGTNNREATFKAGAFAWNVSEEEFMEKTTWLDLLKFRVSWGENGNRSIPLYRSLAGLGTVEYIYSDNGGLSAVTGFSGNRLSNPNLKWESTEALNVGFDFSVYEGALSGSVEYYNTTTTDLLVERALPDVTGFDNILSNLGELGNTGLEVTLSARVMNKPNFAWYANAVYSTNKNEIKELYGDVEDVLDANGNVIGQRLADDLANRRFIGQNIDAIYDFELGSVYSTDEAAEAANFGLVPGDFSVVDQNGDGVIESIVDQKFLGQTVPKHRINLTNDFTLFKNFSLSVSLDAQLGHKDIWNGRFGGGLGPSENWQPQRLNGYQFPYWLPDNQLRDWARIGSANPFGASYYGDKSFVRIQNITMAYDFPNSVTEMLNIASLRLSLDLSNVAIFTDWDYFDPEIYDVYSSSFGSRFGTPAATPVPFVATARLLLTL
ncbi:MAG: SusC/RagA family TonB-linked outer membrane protein, partial [Bacteroidota bacterium]